MTSRGRILVTPRSVTRSGHPALDRLRARGYEVVFCTPGALPGEDELKRLLPGCIGYLAGVEKITASVLKSAAQLKVIARNGTGVDNVDLGAADALGIKVCRAEGANARGVAELTLALILSLARSIPASDRAMKAGKWDRITGFELEGKTLGLLGCGRIGKLVAGFALAMGMRVFAFDAYPDRSFAPSDQFKFASQADVLEQADVLSLHCPPGPGGRPIIDATSLGRMKKGSLLINTARAELVDREALLLALETKRIAGYGVDVYETEPPGVDELISDARVIATPHAGGLTNESVDRAVQIAIDGLLRELE